MTKTALAYCAGIVDADGTIGIKKSSYAMRIVGDCSQATYSERVCVKQVEPHAIDLLHSMFGGYRFKAYPSAKKGRMLEGWQVTDLKAVAFLKAVRPYLRIKSQQADNCLDLRKLKEQSKKIRCAKGRGHVGSAVRPDVLSVAMENLRVRAGELNHVGIQDSDSVHT